MQTTRAIIATPSKRKSGRLTVARISAAASGWRAVALAAANANKPIPKPAQRTTIPAPRPAPSKPPSAAMEVATVNIPRKKALILNIVCFSLLLLSFLLINVLHVLPFL